MLGKQAKVFTARSLRHLVRVAARGRHAERDRLMIYLSVYGGLRACEVARLTWGMVLDPNGRIGTTIEVRHTIAKRGRGRRVPLHPRLRRALAEWRLRCPAEKLAPDAVIIPSLRGGPLRPNSIVNWFIATCRAAGLEGCSSHSGRRTFITNAARRVHRAGASLRDVQLLARHRSIETTQRYIDGDSDAQRRLVALI
jgi:integrase